MFNGSVLGEGGAILFGESCMICIKANIVSLFILYLIPDSLYIILCSLCELLTCLYSRVDAVYTKHGDTVITNQMVSSLTIYLCMPCEHTVSIHTYLLSMYLWWDSALYYVHTLM